jgi:hypothetical protein
LLPQVVINLLVLGEVSIHIYGRKSYWEGYVCMLTIEVALKRLEQMPKKLAQVWDVLQPGINRSNPLTVDAYFMAPQVELDELA